jgi:glutamate synthase (NADPH/NADH) small chain
LATDSLEGEAGHVVRWHGRDTASGEAKSMDVDLVILAMGFLPVARKKLMTQFGLESDERGNIHTAPDGSTNVPGVFVAGDAALGASLVVKAIQTGRQAARGVDEYLKG